jgi:hypothetical protein
MIRSFRLTKPQLFVLLMTLAALAALLPGSCTRWAGGILQPLGWVSAPLTTTIRAAVNAGDARGADLPAAEAAALRGELERAQRQVGQQALTIQELEQRLGELTSIREQLRDPRTRIRLATVIAYDASARRESLLLGRGSNDGVAVGQWVVACSTPPAADASGRDAVMREWLLGRVSEVFPFASRVRLATDPQFARERVRVARILPDGTWQPIGNDCLLFGLGGGAMQIREASADLRAAGGEVVLVPAAADLPVEMTIGRITGSRSVPEAPLFFNLDVRPWGDARRLATVYVIVPGR